MRPRGETGLPDVSDDFTLAHPRPGPHRRGVAREVEIPRDVAVRVADSNCLAAAAFPPGREHDSGAGGAHRRSDWRAQVDPPVRDGLFQDGMETLSGELGRDP